MRAWKIIAAWLLCLLLLGSCGNKGQTAQTPPPVSLAPAPTAVIPETPTPPEETLWEEAGYTYGGEDSPLYTNGGTEDQTSAGETWLDENGSYTTAEDVALYLYTYGQLPDNFITKNEARDLGWSGGSVENYAPGKCIGGDYFGNYEGLLPKGNYHECDINTLGANSRGGERLVWDDRGNIYYTGDHYASFELLYSGTK